MCIQPRGYIRTRVYKRVYKGVYKEVNKGGKQRGFIRGYIRIGHIDTLSSLHLHIASLRIIVDDLLAKQFLGNLQGLLVLF